MASKNWLLNSTVWSGKSRSRCSGKAEAAAAAQQQQQNKSKIVCAKYYYKFIGSIIILIDYKL